MSQEAEGKLRTHPRTKADSEVPQSEQMTEELVALGPAIPRSAVGHVVAETAAERRSERDESTTDNSVHTPSTLEDRRRPLPFTSNDRSSKRICSTMATSPITATSACRT